MRWSLVLALLAGVAVADDSTTTTDSTTSSSSSTSSSSLDLSDATTVTNPSASMPTGSYEVYSTTVTLADGDHITTTFNPNATTTGNSTGAHTTTSNSVTVLVGGSGGGTTTLGNSSMNATATTSTSSTPVATNTRPCNGYTEYCQRQYSNITMVAAHNSPFVRKGNAAANQDFTVKYQLDDGIRMCKSLFISISTPGAPN